MLRGPWRVSPFALAGFGAMAISSDTTLQGRDIDPAFHYGVGMEIFMNRWLAFRLGLRMILMILDYRLRSWVFPERFQMPAPTRELTALPTRDLVLDEEEEEKER